MAQYDHKTQVEEVATAYGIDNDAAATLMNNSGARINAGSYGFQGFYCTYNRNEQATTSAAHAALMEAAPVANEEEAAAETDTSTEATFIKKESALYGEGRIYNSQPGATQYDNGSGSFSVQIWDN